MTPIRRQRGFTLIEMIVAMGILVVGVSSILALLSFGATLQQTAESRNEAALAAAQVIDELRNDPQIFSLQKDGSVSAPSTLSITREIAGHPRLTAFVEMRENPALAGEYTAMVRIGWKERGQRRTESFRTILQRQAPFLRRVEHAIERSQNPKN